MGPQIYNDPNLQSRKAFWPCKQKKQKAQTYYAPKKPILPGYKKHEELKRKTSDARKTMTLLLSSTGRVTLLKRIANTSSEPIWGK